MIMGGLLALIGHSASVFLHFKGGKGVATGLGIILYLAPVETAIVFFIWCVIVGLTRLVSLGSVAAALLVPLTMWYFKEPWPVFIFGTVAALIVIVRHKDNLLSTFARLLSLRKMPNYVKSPSVARYCL